MFAWVEIVEGQIVIYKDRLSVINVGQYLLTVELFDENSLRYGLVNRYDFKVKIGFKPYVPPSLIEFVKEI